MSDHPGNGKSFKANIENLFDELQLAFQWSRPSILLAVNKSKSGETKARQALELKLRSSQWKVVEISLGDEHSDAARLILQAGNIDNTVFFVSGLDRGGGPDGMDAYRALNLDRETLVVNRIKLVLWMTPNEASSLPRFAPDFWAFRHRYVEFISSSVQLSGPSLTRLLMWHDGDLLEPPGDLQDKIQNYARLVEELPRSLDSLAMRIESLYLLGHACWAAGDTGRALKSFVSGAGLARHETFTGIRSWLLNGIAIVRHERGESQAAFNIYEDLGSENREDAILLMNTGIALCALGKNYDGVSQSTRAAAREPSNAKLWNRLGHIHLLMSRYDDAVAAFEKAVVLAPTQAGYFESLAVCHAILGNTDEALTHIRKAGQLGHQPYDRSAIIGKAILGETEEAMELLSAAIRAGHISASNVRRDSNLNLILDDPLDSREV